MTLIVKIKQTKTIVKKKSFTKFHYFTLAFLVLFIVLKFSVLAISTRFYGKSIVISGYHSDRFERVHEEFRKNFAEGLERDGASFAVYHKGELVVDFTGGYANSKTREPWTKNTRTFLFSTTKALSALCIAVLVDQGKVKWDDPVVKFWPEYGLNGKENTTIQQVLSHQAGIPYISETIFYEDALNITTAMAKIARATPIWEPGSKTGYHALSWGWIVEGIVHHADSRHRHLGQFFKEEIADKYDLDISIGANSQLDFLRSAVLTTPTPFDYMRDTLIDLRMLFMIGAYYFQPSNSIISLSAKNPHWLPIEEENISFNSYRIQQLKLGAANGLSGAKDLARLFSLFIDGKIVSNQTLQQFSRPIVDDWHFEQTVLYPIMKGFGFFYEYHPKIPNKFVFGHPGFGGQSLHVDMEEELVVVYLSNGLKASTSILCHPYQRLLSSVYESI